MSLASPYRHSKLFTPNLCFADRVLRFRTKCVNCQQSSLVWKLGLVWHRKSFDSPFDFS